MDRCGPPSGQQRGTIVRFDAKGKPQAMIRLDSPADSLAFGQKGSTLDGLLFISNNDPTGPQTGSLVMVDLTTLQRITVATGGTRGDVVRTTADGRVLLSQSQQVDVLAPVRAPLVAFTNPPANAVVALPRGSLSVTFDTDMFAGDASLAGSVLNPANYELVGADTGPQTIESIRYDATQRTATIVYQRWQADTFTLRVKTSLVSADQIALAQQYSVTFQAISDFTPNVKIGFSNARANTIEQTVTYTLSVTNLTGYDLLTPMYLTLDSFQPNNAIPLGAMLDQDTGSYRLDLAALLPGGVLQTSQTVTTNITFVNPSNARLNFRSGLMAKAYPNEAPEFTSQPLTAAVAGEPYQYQASAVDPDGVLLDYLLLSGPSGMTIDQSSGLVAWQPTSADRVVTPVILQVYDSRGGSDTQRFTIDVSGGNHPPEIAPLPASITGSEGTPLEIAVSVSDPDADLLRVTAENLPPGAVFDAAERILRWTPGFQAAGTYPDVRFVVSDGTHLVSRSLTILVTPVDQAPLLTRPADQTVREGDTIRIPLSASDPEGQPLTYYSLLLPGGALLDPNTGVLEWTPTYFQAGEYNIPITVSDGVGETTKPFQITVLNANAAPQFDDIGYWELAEGQLLYFQAFAYDPDNPSFVPPYRKADGTLLNVEETAPSVVVTASDLPAGATFDSDTWEMHWAPSFAQAGEYFVTFTATDDGNGTGLPLLAQTTARIVVANANRPPQIVPIDNRTLASGTTLDVPVVVTDPDGNPMEITVQGLPAFGTYTATGVGTGTIRFTPGDRTRGDYVLTVVARDDGDGGGKSTILSTLEGFVLTVTAANEPPQLGFLSDQVAVVGQQLKIAVTATDLDQETLVYALAGLPAGATLTPGAAYGTATLTWTPTVNDLGLYSANITVSDGGNGQPALAASDTRNIRIVVRDSNQAPDLQPIGNRQVSEGQLLEVVPLTIDPDGDSPFYTASNLPAGAQLNPTTGKLSWTPHLFQSGVYPNIRLSASDGNRTDSETFTITVLNTNQPPTVVPLPEQRAREGTQLQFTIAAADVDGDALQLSATGLPAGATFDTTTRQFRWTPGFEQAGNYQVKVRASDGTLFDEITIPIRVDNVNRTPTLDVSHHRAQVGKTLTFAVVGSDPDANTVLTYKAIGLPAGATFDAQTGLFTWTPLPSQEGDHVVGMSVSDGQATTSQAVLLRVSIDAVLPDVTVQLTPGFPGLAGQPVLVQVIASAVSPIVQKTLHINGQSIALDTQGRATYVPAAAGLHIIEATATDGDGNVRTVFSAIRTRDPADTAAPVVQLEPRLQSQRLTSTTSITGSISDTNLESWVLELAPLGSQDFLRVAGGVTTLSNANLYTFDPTQVPNGFYLFRLTATDIGGRTSQTEVMVEVNTTTKPTRYTTSQIDLTTTLGGVPISLTRRYDSLERDQLGTFGYGWNLVNQDIRITPGVTATGREELGVYQPFRVGTRVYASLPDGQSVGFTFTPLKVQLPGLVYFTPAFTADAGVAWKLESASALLTQAGDRFYDLFSGAPYHPASGVFPGAHYTLTDPDGTIYQVDSQRGVQTQINPDQTRLSFSDSGITSSSGGFLQIVRDSFGRPTKIIAPDGTQLVYTYDAQGNLINARNLALGRSSRYGYDRDDEHLLTLAIPAGQAGDLIQHGTSAPQVLPLNADLGGTGQFTAASITGTLVAGGTNRYAISLRPSELSLSQTGRVYVSVLVEATSGSSLSPQVPSIAGLQPLLTNTTTNTAFAIFGVDRDGLQTIELAGANATTSGGLSPEPLDRGRRGPQWHGGWRRYRLVDAGAWHVLRPTRFSGRGRFESRQPHRPDRRPVAGWQLWLRGQ